MSLKAILVTGGVGSTAHSAIATLRERGHSVRAMVRRLDAPISKARNNAKPDS